MRPSPYRIEPIVGHKALGLLNDPHELLIRETKSRHAVKRDG